MKITSVSVVEPDVQIVLSRYEAGVLLTVLGAVCGDPEGPHSVTERLYRGIEALGVICRGVILDDYECSGIRLG